MSGNIVANFDIDALIAKATGIVQDVIDDIVLALKYACIDTVSAARALPSPPAEVRGTPHQPHYIDDTGYLRGSIGYAIYKDGTLLADDFKGTENGNAGSGAAQGQEAGKNLAAEVAGQYVGQGIVAIVVCGADYAAAVESNGYDVLTGSTKELANIFKDNLKQVKQRHGL